MKVCKKVDCIHYSNNLKCGLHDEDCKNYSNYNSYGYHNYDEIVARFLECEEELQMVKKQLKQLKSEQNKTAVEKLEEFKGKLREADEIAVYKGYLDKIDTFELLNEFIEELKGESDE